MMINLNPVSSTLGIVIDNHESFLNKKGKLNVVFRYDNSKLCSFKNGFQVQLETISQNEHRGNHYHYPEFAGEEFFLMSGYAALIVSNLDRSVVEMFFLKKHITYYVPAYIAHKVQNIGHLLNKKKDVELLISKHYNYQTQNLQKLFVISSEITDKYLIDLL